MTGHTIRLEGQRSPSLLRACACEGGCSRGCWRRREMESDTQYAGCSHLQHAAMSLTGLRSV